MVEIMIANHPAHCSAGLFSADKLNNIRQTTNALIAWGLPFSVIMASSLLGPMNA